ncbi:MULTISPECIES: ATP-binding protein [Deinococcus]|uniref:ATP-binding protein n=1 Tax=Deinococcus rufus TaxID=2136097 RepID=A0ABV7Z4M4_9DEIO|nr:ATP-binding protein [Deinococcus sp. AB2017081]WQE96450.1 ATP-binding protein [Deinococcus sp. AB2017081]
MTDDAVISGLEAAVQASPENHALRLHLTSLLLQAHRAADALAHATAVLAAQPAHLEALRLAAWSAEEAGDTARATGYQQLHNALTGVQVPPVPPPEHPTSPYAVVGTPRTEPLRAHAQPAPPEPSELLETGLPRVTFADVAGMAEVKQRLERALLAPMRNPELTRLYGKSLRGGLLMYGPPGCGKTYIARAVAGELDARFLSVGLSEILDMYIGQSERNLHAVFEEARRRAPCVLFLDEIDALGRRRSQMRHSGANVVNQLLAELDGATTSNDGVFVLAATNSPWDVDPALRRPGRFDRTVLVVPPDTEARRALLDLHLRGRLHEGLDTADVAARTDGYSGADLAHVVDSAAELALEDSIRSGTARPIGPKDVARVLRDVKPSTGPWFETARNVAQFANEGGAYDDLVAYMRSRRLL